MADKFLNFNGLTAFYNKIKALFANKVDKAITYESSSSTDKTTFNEDGKINMRSQGKSNDIISYTTYRPDGMTCNRGTKTDDYSYSGFGCEDLWFHDHVNGCSTVINGQEASMEKQRETSATTFYDYTSVKAGNITLGTEDSGTGTRTDSFALDGVNNTVSMNADLVTSFKNVLGISGGGGGGDYMVKGVDYVTAGQKAGTTLGTKATAEGNGTTASGNYSHAEGNGTTASGYHSHAEGQSNTASGACSHAEGASTTASGHYSHAEGQSNTASGTCSHVEGALTTASGHFSHAEGNGTTANRQSQHVFGSWNIVDTGGNGASERGKYIEIVGNGTTYNTRSNARTLDWNGNEWLAGTLKVGGTSYDDAKAVATEDSIAALQTQIDGLGEPFRVKEWSNDNLTNITIPSCNQDISNTSIDKVVFSITGQEGIDYQVVGMIAYQITDTSNNRINCWPVCQFTGNGQKELHVRFMGAGTSNKTAKSIKAWVLLKHR